MATKEFYTADGQRVEKREDSLGREYHVREGDGRISEAAYRGLQSQRDGNVYDLRGRGTMTVPDGDGGFERVIVTEQEMREAGEAIENRRVSDTATVEVAGDDRSVGGLRRAAERAPEFGGDIMHYD